MFGIIGTREREKSKEDIRYEMMMLRDDAQQRIDQMCISCWTCKDFGVVAVAYISIDSPDEPYIEYNRCSCGAKVHPRLAEFMRDQE